MAGAWPRRSSRSAASRSPRAIYDTLTVPGADGKIHPYLAQSVTGNANGTVWTIKLRSGIKFSDGSALTAQVVKDNLDAYRGALKPIRNPLLFSFVFSDISAVTVVNPLTVSVTTKRPWQAFPWFLWCSGRLGIMGEAQVKSPKNCNTDLIGTGPFKEVSWVEGDKFVAKRNPNYWQKDSKGVQLPYLDRHHVRTARRQRQARVGARSRRLQHHRERRSVTDRGDPQGSRSRYA